MNTSAGRYSLTYVNKKNEAFHVHILATPPPPPTTTIFDEHSEHKIESKINTVFVSEDTPCTSTEPVLLCVHGAGMSGDNFIRLADHLSQTLSCNEDYVQNNHNSSAVKEDVITDACAAATFSHVTTNTTSDNNTRSSNIVHDFKGNLNNDDVKGPNTNVITGHKSLSYTHTPPYLPPHNTNTANSNTEKMKGGVLRGNPLPLSPARQAALPDSSLLPHTHDNSKETNTTNTITTLDDKTSATRVTTICTGAHHASVAPHSLQTKNDSLGMFVITYDLRCHGLSTFNGGEGSLTLEVLINDFIDILVYTRRLFPRSSFYILGHSLGGAIVATALNKKSSIDISTENDNINSNTSYKKENDTSSSSSFQFVAGIILLDVVEGTARASLQLMNDFLSRRPESFVSIDEAVKWFLRFGGMHSIEGAQVSVPPLLKCVETSTTSISTSSSSSASALETAAQEVGKCDEAQLCKSKNITISGGRHKPRWVWRSNLHKMEYVWNGWFVGLDSAFIALPFPKMLCLANMERLDTELIVAQMQGKFQFEVMGNNCGHYIMDDAPSALAAKIQRFVKRIEGMKETLQQKLRRPPQEANKSIFNR